MKCKHTCPKMGKEKIPGPTDTPVHRVYSLANHPSFVIQTVGKGQFIVIKKG